MPPRRRSFADGDAESEDEDFEPQRKKRRTFRKKQQPRKGDAFAEDANSDENEVEAETEDDAPLQPVIADVIAFLQACHAQGIHAKQSDINTKILGEEHKKKKDRIMSIVQRRFLEVFDIEVYNIGTQASAARSTSMTDQRKQHKKKPKKKASTNVAPANAKWALRSRAVMSGAGVPAPQKSFMGIVTATLLVVLGCYEFVASKRKILEAFASWGVGNDDTTVRAYNGTAEEVLKRLEKMQYLQKLLLSDGHNRQVAYTFGNRARAELPPWQLYRLLQTKLRRQPMTAASNKLVSHMVREQAEMSHLPFAPRPEPREGVDKFAAEQNAKSKKKSK
ncbi:MAG: hypothetical protein MHM6MM_003896 [Cercozoa sp. M6MM]